MLLHFSHSADPAVRDVVFLKPVVGHKELSDGGLCVFSGGPWAPSGRAPPLPWMLGRWALWRAHRHISCVVLVHLLPPLFLPSPALDFHGAKLSSTIAKLEVWCGVPAQLSPMMIVCA